MFSSGIPWNHLLFLGMQRFFEGPAVLRPGEPLESRLLFVEPLNGNSEPY